MIRISNLVSRIPYPRGLMERGVLFYCLEGEGGTCLDGWIGLLGDRQLVL